METNNGIKQAIEGLRVSDAKTVAEVIGTKKEFKNFQSCRVWTQMQLNLLVDTGKLKRGKGWYALPSYRGEYKDHDRLLTKALAEILKLKYDIVIHREVSFEPALRSDAVVLLRDGGKALCFVLEVVHNETPEYLQMKLNTWKSFKGSNKALSQLFGYRIPSFGIIVSRNQPDDQFNQFIGGLK